MQPGEALLLENLRFYAEEEGKPRGLAEDATDEEKAAAKKAVKESQMLDSLEHLKDMETIREVSSVIREY